MRFVLNGTRCGLRSSTTRIPFRYGNTCLTTCPQAVFEATIEADGHIVRGFSADCLPPGWFDKTPGRSFDEQIADMLAATHEAAAIFADEAASSVDFFTAWYASYERIQRWAEERHLGALVASFGLSFVERAVMDGLARAAELSFAKAVRTNLYAIDAGRVHPELAGLSPSDWLPPEPRQWVCVRHTVGLGDPLTERDITPDDRVDDGYPQALEQYLESKGIQYFKVKLSGRLDEDRRRLLDFVDVVERHRGADYRLTLDGNEQFKRAEEFDSLIDMLQSTPQLANLLANTLAIEQPLERSVSLAAEHTAGIGRLGETLPVIIDEADGTLDSFKQAMSLGYRGTSSKNCKGPVKSLLNAGLVWLANDRGGRSQYIITGEDLCSVGIIATQADLCLAATLGLEHVERNGHHYHPGLSYLPAAQQKAALAAHADFYGDDGGVVRPCVRDGRFQIGSLQCEGFGFDVLPDFAAMQLVGTALG